MFDACFGLLWEPALCQDVNYAHLLDLLKHLVLYNRNYAFAACRPNHKILSKLRFSVMALPAPPRVQPWKTARLGSPQKQMRRKSDVEGGAALQDALCLLDAMQRGGTLRLNLSLVS